jgi:hypothetical protein
MPSEEFELMKADVKRLVESYITDDDMDRMMNRMRRVLDWGLDAVAPLLLAKEQHRKNKDLGKFIVNVINEIHRQNESHDIAGRSNHSHTARAINSIVFNIAAALKEGDDKKAQGLEEVLAMIGMLSLSELESAKKNSTTEDKREILDRIIKQVKQSEQTRMSDSRIGQPDSKNVIKRLTRQIKDKFSKGADRTLKN